MKRYETLEEGGTLYSVHTPRVGQIHCKFEFCGKIKCDRAQENVP